MAAEIAVADHNTRFVLSNQQKTQNCIKRVEKK